MPMSSSEMCRVCTQPTTFAFTNEVRGRRVNYFDCPHCAYVQTETPYWLEEAYATPIGDADTGILYRNRLNVGRVLMALLAGGKLSGCVADMGGGYGILVRMLRDIGVDAYWRDKYCSNLLAQGFDTQASSYDLVTAFEVLEHMTDPVSEIRSMLTVAPIVLVSTDLAPPPTALRPDWWYLVPEYGQHIGFLRRQTLKKIAAALHCSYASDGQALHMFSLDPVVASRWSKLRRLHPLSRLIARVALRSRMMSDFEVLRHRQQALQSSRHSPQPSNQP